MEEDEAKAMSRDELAEILALVPDQWHLLFWFLAATGVRISEPSRSSGGTWRSMRLSPRQGPSCACEGAYGTAKEPLRPS